MIQLYSFFLIISICSIDPFSRTVLNDTFFSQLEDLILPSLNSKLDNVSLPDYHKKIPIFEVNITNSSFHINPILSSQVFINELYLSPKLQVYAYSIEGNASININYEMAGIRDYILCKAYLRNMKIESTITNDISKTGSPLVKVSANLNMDPLKAELVFTGGVTAKVLELLEPIIKVFLVEATDISINRNLYKWIADEINRILGYFNVDLKINNDYYVNYELSSLPLYQNSCLPISFTGYVYYQGEKQRPLHSYCPYPLFNPNYNKTIQILLCQDLLDSAIDVAYEKNSFTINYTYNEINPFDLNVSCYLSQEPIVIFSVSILLEMWFICNASALNKTDGKLTNLSARGELSLTLSNTYNKSKTAILFKIQKYEIDYFYFLEKPDYFNGDWIINNLNRIALFPTSVINDTLLADGIPLPIIQNVSFIDMEIKIEYLFYIGIYTNIKL